MSLRLSLAPARAALLGTIAAAALSACGGGGSSSSNVPLCGSDTQYQLASPQSGAYVGPGTPTVEIVANGSSNQIYNSFQNFDLLFVPTNASYPTVPTGSLSQSSDPNGYHPYSSDFYYKGTVLSPGLTAGLTYNVYLNVFTSNCSPIGPIGQLGT
ncbi:MAG: hypothetical protein M3R53_07235 [Candidatus Eremiobacteraeota bacterium]|nr:hypothetical protein [Candidatus Eremiobacteraeota bacterium]